MENKQVLTAEELNQLKEIQDLYSKVILDLGQIDIQVDGLERMINQLTDQKKSILNQYQELQEKEKNIGQVLSSKYGDGTIDPKTGEFTPTK